MLLNTQEQALRTLIGANGSATQRLGLLIICMSAIVGIMTVMIGIEYVYRGTVDALLTGTFRLIVGAIVSLAGIEKAIVYFYGTRGEGGKNASTQTNGTS